MTLSKRSLLIVAPVLLLFVAGAVYAGQNWPPRVSWEPAQLVTESMAPGETATYSVVLKATGVLPVPATQQLRLVAEGDIAPYVTITQPTFPRLFKRGDQVTVQLDVSVPADAGVGVYEGNVVLQRILPNKKVMEVWRAEALAVSVEVSSSLTPKQAIQSLEDQGALPKLDRSSDVQGPDVNANDIRDDIDAYIAVHYTDPPQRAAAEQLARALQSAMLVDKTDVAAAKAIDVRVSRAVNCIYSHFDENAGSRPPAAVVEELESVSTNTRARLLDYLAFSKALDGTVGSIPEGDTCE